LRWLARWWPAILWAVFISALSTAGFSSERTGRFLIPPLHWLFPRASYDTLLLIHHLIRKIGHFSEYFVLSVFILRGIRAGRREAHLAWALIAIAVIASYAAFDEWHQSSVPGRELELSDILLDTSAGVAAQAIAALVLLRGRGPELHAAKHEISSPK